MNRQTPRRGYGSSSATAELRFGVRGLRGAVTYAYGSCGSWGRKMRRKRSQAVRTFFRMG